ncbi:hypothetical protein L1049_015179 [Liquidambar formosana]|uniref:Uncharacterized protein n=1 Tax=Liquidambar formosana TaxID=63359 RepID=A0AAP0S3V2_LIQFO
MMVGIAIFRSFIVSSNPSSFSFVGRLLCVSRLHFHASPTAPLVLHLTILSTIVTFIPLAKRILSFVASPLTTSNSAKQRMLYPIAIATTRLYTTFSSSSQANTNFNLYDSKFDEEENQNKKEQINKSILPPPYDPFNKKPVIEEPKDPSNLQKVFHKIRTNRLMQNAVKMFAALSNVESHHRLSRRC